jgi:hypothetical protein
MREHVSQHAGEHVSQHAREHVSQHAREHVSQHAREHVSQHAFVPNAREHTRVHVEGSYVASHSSCDDVMLTCACAHSSRDAVRLDLHVHIHEHIRLACRKIKYVLGGCTFEPSNFSSVVALLVYAEQFLRFT